MNDTILQILLILAYLAIGLIAVTFPIYAISVNYLPQEKQESEKERKRRIEKIKNRITNLTKDLSEETKYTERVAKIKEQIERYEIELTSTELKADYLTAKGAVRRPIIKLVLSLLTTGIGIFFFIYDEPIAVIVFGLTSSGLSIMALYNLYKTISAVEYAALRPARTVEFNVELVDPETLKQKSQIKLGKESGLSIELFTDDQDVENFHAFVTIPSAIRADTESIMDTPGIRAKAYEDETIVCIEEAFLPKSVVEYINIPIVAKKIGKHSLLVRIYGKNIHEYVEEFILKVVK